MKKTYVISELCGNHEGNIDLAKRLIDISYVAKVDACKFQKRTPSICISKSQQETIKELADGEKVTYLEYRERIEFGQKEYEILNKYCKNKKLDFGVSIWDLPSLSFIINFDIDFIKIPSALITNDELLIETAKWCDINNKLFIFSIGMSNYAEINKAICLTKQHMVNNGVFGVLLCNSAYPAQVSNLNLAKINSLRKQFNNIKWGYSSHELGIDIASACPYLGLEIIEKHITHDKTGWGIDKITSLNPDELIQMVQRIRLLEKAYGIDKIEVTDDELIHREKLRKN